MTYFRAVTVNFNLYLPAENIEAYTNKNKMRKVVLFGLLAVLVVSQITIEEANKAVDQESYLTDNGY